MDANKRIKLVEIGYKIHSTCKDCMYCRWPDSPSGFTTCTKFKYEHLKHTERQRELSIYLSGGCSSFTERTNSDLSNTNNLPWREFLVNLN